MASNIAATSLGRLSRSALLAARLRGASKAPPSLVAPPSLLSPGGAASLRLGEVQAPPRPFGSLMDQPYGARAARGAPRAGLGRARPGRRRSSRTRSTRYPG